MTEIGELLDLVFDALLVELPELHPAGDGGGWREPLSAWLSALRDLCLRHPWWPALYAERPMIGPQSLLVMERLTAVLAGAGFEGADLDAATMMLLHLVVGTALLETTWSTWTSRNAVDVTAVQDYVLGAVADLPHTDGLLREYVAREPAAAVSEARWRLALDAALDGLQARLAGA